MAGEVYGLDGPDLPDGWTPLSAIVIVKAFDADGTMAWCSRIASDLTKVEALGMLRMVEQWTLDELRVEDD